MITLDTALLYTHYSTEANGVTAKCEVILLTRNIVFRGDADTSNTNYFGAHIMLNSSHGDELSIGRIENVEFTDVGQAFQLGRYPIHFHMSGIVQESYVRNNSIH